MTVPRTLQIMVLLVILTGCSRVQFAYNQLDWLIPDYLEAYVNFSDQQRVMVDEKVGALLNWHCSTQLGTYAEWVRSANADFQAKSMTKERLREHTAQLEGYWRAITRRASPAIADLLLTVSDEQIEELFVVFMEKNAEWREEFEAETDEERRQRYRERMTEELERWFGPLNRSQQRAVLEWSGRVTPVGLVGLESRRRWQANLRDAIDGRADETAFDKGIEVLFVTPRALRASALQNRYDDNRALALELIHQIATHMDDEQRNHLANQAESVARDFDDLVCVPELPGVGKQEDRRTGTQPERDGRSDP